MAQVDKVQLKVIMDKENNRVLWVEAEKDFVDVLCSFLTLPLGTIARLVSQKSNIEPIRVGSLSSLYQSVADLKEERFFIKTCKEMLLSPRNSMETNCKKMKLNIDDTPMHYFTCYCEKSWSTFRYQKCYCKGDISKQVTPVLQNGFVKETAPFIICEGLHVIPYNFATTVALLQKLGVHNSDAIEEQRFDFGKKEVIDLLKLSLVSKFPLNDLIQKKKQLHEYSNPLDQSCFVVGKLQSNEGRKMSIKVTLRKSTTEFLFAEGDQDFVDFLFSFLTFPLGGVMHMLESSSSLCCIDNLYKSLSMLTPDKFLCSSNDQLTKPKCFQNFELKKQILPIGVASLPSPIIKLPPVSFVGPKFSCIISSDSGEFVKGPSLYMVTNDLVVTPMSSTSAFSYLNRSKVPLSDLETTIIEIGVKEGLCLLKASLISTSVMTNVFKSLISSSTVKEEK